MNKLQELSYVSHLIKKQEAYFVMFTLLSVYLIVFITRTPGYFYGPFLMVAPILGAISVADYKKHKINYEHN